MPPTLVKFSELKKPDINMPAYIAKPRTLK